MTSHRFRFALQNISGERWKIFEELCSRFLSTEDQNFRTTACSSGDGGRDAELLFQTETINTMAQYSVQSSWKDKINNTLKSINKNFKQTKILLYLTNQEIGANGDELKNTARKDYDIFLDIRDINWFLDRQFQNRAYENAAEIFCQEIADPILASKGLIKSEKRNPLSSKIMEDAFYYISLETEEKTNEQNLTKLTFDGIIKSILKDTNSENRISVEDIQTSIISLFPEHKSDEIRSKTTAALDRLKKKYIRHWQKENEYCLSDEGIQDQRERLARSEATKEKINIAIIDHFHTAVKPRTISLSEKQQEKIIHITDRTIQSLAIDRGLQFVNAVMFDKMEEIPSGDYVRHIARNCDDLAIKGINKATLITILTKTIASILSSNSIEIQQYLRSINESYVLLFLSRQTIDSQKVISELFLSGEMWLDTNIILPAISEQIDVIDEAQGRPFSELLLNANKNIIKLYITPGVLEEIERHFSRSYACWQQTPYKWEGDTPFLLKRYVENGMPYSEFPAWMRKFQGASRPIDDLKEYLSEQFNININPHTTETDLLTPDQILCIEEAWNQSHLNSKQKYKYIDTITALRLAKHDIENFIGIIERRKSDTAGLSHSKWWLTLDRNAFRIYRMLQQTFPTHSFINPIISIDFLINYLLLGPNRKFTTQNTISIFPHFIEMAKNNYFTNEVFEISEKIYNEMKGYEPRVIRRHVRDEIDGFKQAHSMPDGPIRVLGRIERIIPEV